MGFKNLLFKCKNLNYFPKLLKEQYLLKNQSLTLKKSHLLNLKYLFQKSNRLQKWKGLKLSRLNNRMLQNQNNLHFMDFTNVILILTEMTKKKNLLIQNTKLFHKFKSNSLLLKNQTLRKSKKRLLNEQFNLLFHLQTNTNRVMKKVWLTGLWTYLMI